MLELSLHTVICGRSRKNIKLIESTTNTAIYFPPPFSQVYRYCPPGAQRRNSEEIFITGESPKHIALAKQKIHELVTRTRIFMKDAVVSAAKIDSILLNRLEKIRKIMEVNGTFIQFPALGSQRNMIRIQGVEGLHVERTVRDVMSLVSLVLIINYFVLTFARPANFTVLHGGSSRSTQTDFPSQTRSGTCWPISVLIRMLISLSINSTSISLDPTMP